MGMYKKKEYGLDDALETGGEEDNFTISRPSTSITVKLKAHDKHNPPSKSFKIYSDVNTINYSSIAGPALIIVNSLEELTKIANKIPVGVKDIYMIIINTHTKENINALCRSVAIYLNYQFPPNSGFVSVIETVPLYRIEHYPGTDVHFLNKITIIDPSTFNLND
jgi:hypothetical protein